MHGIVAKFPCWLIGNLVPSEVVVDLGHLLHLLLMILLWQQLIDAMLVLTLRLFELLWIFILVLFLPGTHLVTALSSTRRW